MATERGKKSQEYWANMSPEERERISKRYKASWTAKRRKKRSADQKRLWAEADEEKKKRMHTNWQSNGLEKQTPARVKQISRKGVEARQDPKWLAKYRPILAERGRKKMLEIWNDPVKRAELLAKLKENANRPEIRAKNIANLERGKLTNRMLNRAKKRFREEGGRLDVSEIHYTLQSFQYRQDLLYSLAQGATHEYGVTVEPNMPIDYYEDIIAFFRPDLLPKDEDVDIH